MGQAKQRKKLMGETYGKVANPWLKKKDALVWGGFTETITVTQDDVANLLIALGDRTPVLSAYLKKLWGLFFDRADRGPDEFPTVPTLPPEERAVLEQVLRVKSS
jgi:hypothetical protein